MFEDFKCEMRITHPASTWLQRPQKHHHLHKPGKGFVPERNRRVPCEVAQNLDEASKLLEVGFEYVTDMGDAKLFRKRK